MGSVTTPIRWIRQNVFGVTQDEMAAIGGVSRPRVSRYETCDPLPFDFMERVRAEAIQRGLPFSGDWFFEPPGSRPADPATDEGTGQ